MSGERGERRARLDVLARDEDDARLLRWTHCLELGVTQAKLLLQLLLVRARARARARASFSCSSGCKGTGQKARGHRTARSARSATSEAASSSTKDSGCAPKEPRAGQSRQGRPRRRRGRAWALPGVFRPCMYIYAWPCSAMRLCVCRRVERDRRRLDDRLLPAVWPGAGAAQARARVVGRGQVRELGGAWRTYTASISGSVPRAIGRVSSALRDLEAAAPRVRGCDPIRTC